MREYLLTACVSPQIWGADAGVSHSPPSVLVWKNQGSWGTGGNIRTYLVNAEGEVGCAGKRGRVTSSRFLWVGGRGGWQWQNPNFNISVIFSWNKTLYNTEIIKYLYVSLRFWGKFWKTLIVLVTSIDFFPILGKYFGRNLSVYFQRRQDNYCWQFKLRLYSIYNILRCNVDINVGR